MDDFIQKELVKCSSLEEKTLTNFQLREREKMAEEVECECWELNNPTDKADNSSLDIRPNQCLP